jgi:glycosyltransferase involved in cell wall biosynthesis
MADDRTLRAARARTSAWLSRPPRVLCLSPFFAPSANAEAFCGAKVGLALLKAGVDFSAVSVDYSGHAKFTTDSSGLWSTLVRHTTAVPPAGGTPKLLSAPLGFRYGTLEWSRWVHAVVRLAVARHRERPFDVIYSRGLPNIAHVAAYWMRRASGLPWIANFNDPWDLEGAHLLPHHRKQRKRTLNSRVSDFWMRRVMRSADVITFPCARLRDYHLRLAPARGQCLVIPHIGLRADRAEAVRAFSLVHAGSLGAGESTRRDSTVSLLRALREFLNLRPTARSACRLVLVGPEDRPTLQLASELGVADVVSCTGRVSYEESLRRMTQAAVCLLVEGNMPEGIYLPSKFPDYIQNGKPVIALSPAVGTIADLVPTRGVNVVPVNSPDLIQREINRHYELYAAGELESYRPTAELQGQYAPAAIGARLRELFTELSARSEPVRR